MLLIGPLDLLFNAVCKNIKKVILILFTQRYDLSDSSRIIFFSKNADSFDGLIEKRKINLDTSEVDLLIILKSNTSIFFILSKSGIIVASECASASCFIYFFSRVYIFPSYY